MSSLTSTVEQVAERYASLRVTVGDEGKTRLKGPLQNTGTLDQHAFTEITPAIGRQYGSDLQLKDFLAADESALKDLAQIGKFRGVDQSGCSWSAEVGPDQRSFTQ